MFAVAKGAIASKAALHVDAFLRADFRRLHALVHVATPQTLFVVEEAWTAAKRWRKSAAEMRGREEEGERENFGIE